MIGHEFVIAVALFASRLDNGLSVVSRESNTLHIVHGPPSAGKGPSEQLDEQPLRRHHAQIRPGCRADKTLLRHPWETINDPVYFDHATARRQTSITCQANGEWSTNTETCTGE